MARLRDCAFVVTRNSGVGFGGPNLAKPGPVRAERLYHHVALNVADLGIDAALTRAPDQAPAIKRYLDWFLRRSSLDMMAPDADDCLLVAMKKGGWPV